LLGTLLGLLETDVLGGYDRSGSWAVALPALRDSDEQTFVENHEGLHHEPGVVTVGLVGAMAGLLARRGRLPYQLGEVRGDVDRVVQHAPDPGGITTTARGVRKRHLAARCPSTFTP
jgi:hypothetical protein